MTNTLQHIHDPSILQVNFTNVKPAHRVHQTSPQNCENHIFKEVQYSQAKINSMRGLCLPLIAPPTLFLSTAPAGLGTVKSNPKHKRVHNTVNNTITCK